MIKILDTNNSAYDKKMWQDCLIVMAELAKFVCNNDWAGASRGIDYR